MLTEEKREEKSDGEPKSVTAYFEVTLACNLNCPHCHLSVEQRRNSPLTRKFEEVVVDLSILQRELGVSKIVFSGGEPTLHPQLTEIIEFASRRFSVSMISNGTKPTLLKDLSKKVDTWVSLDYFGEAEDKWRGKLGLWSNYLSIADYVNIRATLLRDNLKDVEKLIDKASQHKKQMTIVPYHGFDLALSPSPEDLQELLLYIFQNHYETFTVIDEPCIRAYLYLENGLSLPKSLCDACESIIKVAPNGQVYPCPFLSKPITSISDPELKQKIVSTRASIIKTHSGKCQNCVQNMLCGGCRASGNEYCFL